MKNKLQNIIKHIKTMFYNLVSGQFKKSQPDTISKNSKIKHDTRLLKSMDDYKINFDLDSKIAWNRHRMREQFEMYKKIENYYPVFLAFLGFIGIYYLDFIILLINNFNHWFLFTTSLTTIGLIISIYYMVKIMFTNKWNHDGRPIRIYKELFDDVTIEETEKNNGVKPNLEILDRVTRESYLVGLEEDLEQNFSIYSKKKKNINYVLKFMFIVLILYSINITHYKQLEFMAKIKKERVDESEKPKTNAPIIKEQSGQSNVSNYNEFNVSKNIENIKPFTKKVLNFDEYNNLPDCDPRKNNVKSFIKKCVTESLEEIELEKKSKTDK